MDISPAKILKLWSRVNDRFGPGDEDEDVHRNDKGKGKKKPASPKIKQAETGNKRIGALLTRLRTVSRGNMADAGTKGKFIKTRDKAVLSLKHYCQLLKGDTLKDAVQDLGKFRRAVKALTAVVAELEPKPFPEEDGEANLDALDGVDISRLDAEMLDPRFGAYSAQELSESR